MLARVRLLIASIAVPLLCAACATQDGASEGLMQPVRSATRVEYGSVEAIQVYRKTDSQPINVATLIGGIAGGVIGHQIGGGTGKTVATIGGAIAGGVIGNEIEKNRVEGTRYRVTVHLESGATLNIEDTTDVNLRVGDRVRVENNRIYRE